MIRDPMRDPSLKAEREIGMERLKKGGSTNSPVDLLLFVLKIVLLVLLLPIRLAVTLTNILRRNRSQRGSSAKISEDDARGVILDPTAFQPDPASPSLLASRGVQSVSFLNQREITVTSTGERSPVQIQNTGGASWTINPMGGGSPLEGAVVCDQAGGLGDQTVYFWWNTSHELKRPSTLNFIVTVGEGEKRALLVRIVQ